MVRSTTPIYATKPVGRIIAPSIRPRKKVTPKNLSAGVWVHLALPVCEGHVDEAAGVKLSLVGATLGRLLLLLGLDLGGL